MYEPDTSISILARALTHTKRGTRDLRLLALQAFAIMFGFGVFNAAYSNFAVQSLKIQPMQIGWVESVRETPGFIIVAIAALTMRIAEPMLGAVSLLLMAAGIAAYCFVDNISTLIIFSLTWSLGLHSWMTVSPSIALNLSQEGNRGRRLGQLSSISTVGTVLGYCLVLLIGTSYGFNSLFIIAGVFVLFGAAAMSRISHNIGHPEKPRWVLKRKYGLYYCLTLLEGCRKQVFNTFAIYVLVREYDTTVRAISALMVVNSLVTFYLATKVGRMMNRIGEKKVLTFCYAALIPVFLGYAAIRSREILYVLFCLDSLFFLGSIGLNTYLHKIAEPGDLMPTIAMGVTANHTAAVLVPLIGGILWSRYDYPVTFVGGAVVVAISVLLAARMVSPMRGAIQN